MKIHSQYETDLLIGQALHDNNVARKACKNAAQRRGWDRALKARNADYKQRVNDYKKRVNAAIADDPALCDDPNMYL